MDFKDFFRSILFTTKHKIMKCFNGKRQLIEWMKRIFKEYNRNEIYDMNGKNIGQTVLLVIRRT